MKYGKSVIHPRDVSFSCGIFAWRKSASREEEKENKDSKRRWKIIVLVKEGVVAVIVVVSAEKDYEVWVKNKELIIIFTIMVTLYSFLF